MSGMQWHRLSNGNAACGAEPQKVRATWKTPIPFLSEDGTDSNVNVSIDTSVFARWSSVSEYRPKNLAAWAKCKKIDIASLKDSVLADDPNTAAPD
jgi:hypothetical protein